MCVCGVHRVRVSVADARVLGKVCGKWNAETASFVFLCNGRFLFTLWRPRRVLYMYVDR